MKHRLEDHDSISSAEIYGLREIGGLTFLVTYFFESQVLAKVNYRDDKTHHTCATFSHIFVALSPLD